jgi:tetratricopeptide (TPR) repeat protein
MFSAIFRNTRIRLFMTPYLFALFVLIAPPQAPTPQSVSAVLAQAQMLYYEAKFKESIDLLTPVDSTLRSQPSRLKEKIDVKLQLALSHIGLSETQEARTRFAEICTLDPEYSLDPTKFAPKVVSLFEDIKAQQEKTQCETLCKEAEKLLDAENTEGLLALIQRAGTKCSCVAATALDAATHFYQLGVDAYKKEDSTAALGFFRQALKFQPDNNLARSYIDLTHNQLRLVAERLFLEWRGQVDARQFRPATATYRQLLAANIDGSANDVVDRVRTAYRQELSPLIDSWKRACSLSDSQSMDKIRSQAGEMIPDPAMAGDLLAQMGTCVKKPCLELPPETAITRLRTRQDAKLPPGFPSRRVTVQVKVRIDENGNVVVRDTQNIDPKLRNAVFGAAATWKFLPAVVDNEVRCVETEIPIVFNP